MSNDIKKEVLSNPILKTILEKIENTEEKEKTLKAIEDMLENFQGKFVKISQALKQTNNQKQKEE